MNKLYFFLETNQYVLRETMHRCVKNYLTQYYQVNCQDIKIEKGEFGKPYALRDKEKVGLYFNISHTSEVGIVVFSQDEIGVDIEEIKTPNFGIIKRFYKEAEQNYVMGYDNKTNQAERFYEVWTKKEAYLKYTGQGLVGGLSKIDVLDMKYVFRKYECCGKAYAISVYRENLSELNWELVKIKI